MKNLFFAVLAFSMLAVVSSNKAQADIDGEDILNFVANVADIVHHYNDQDNYDVTDVSFRDYPRNRGPIRRPRMQCSTHVEYRGRRRWAEPVCVETCQRQVVACHSVFVRRNGVQREIFPARGYDVPSCRRNAMDRCFNSVRRDRACQFARNSVQFINRGHGSRTIVPMRMCGRGHIIDGPRHRHPIDRNPPRRGRHRRGR